MTLVDTNAMATDTVTYNVPSSLFLLAFSF